MIEGKKIIALIPARGESKGLPKKNIKELFGKPLIVWSIEQALTSKYIDRVIVSTENEEIAKIAKESGAEVPFLRPKELAQDNSPTIDVILHLINWLEEKGEKFDILILLEPTSPLREVEDINKAIEKLIEQHEAKSIVGISKMENTHPEFSVIMDKKGFIRKPDGSANFKVLRRQELADIYFFEGSVYASHIDALKKYKTFYHEATIGYVVKKYKSLEIDEIVDFICVEALMKARMEGKI